MICYLVECAGSGWSGARPALCKSKFYNVVEDLLWLLYSGMYLMTGSLVLILP